MGSSILFYFFRWISLFKSSTNDKQFIINQINKIKKELDEAENLKVTAKNLLSDYENKIDKSKKEVQ